MTEEDLLTRSSWGFAQLADILASHTAVLALAGLALLLAVAWHERASWGGPRGERGLTLLEVLVVLLLVAVALIAIVTLT